MLRARTSDAGFTLTELMVVVVILSLLAAISTPLFTRDNNARKGRSWTKTVAQLLQRARFEAMGDRANIHVLLYRTRVDTYREEPAGSTPAYTLLSTIRGPVPDDTKTVAIWDAKVNDSTTLPSGQNSALTVTPAAPTSPAAANDIVFTPLGSTENYGNWRIFLRNELLSSNHPDASFVIDILGLTGYITTNDKVVLP